MKMWLYYIGKECYPHVAVLLVATVHACCSAHLVILILTYFPPRIGITTCRFTNICIVPYNDSF